MAIEIQADSAVATGIEVKPVAGDIAALLEIPSTDLRSWFLETQIEDAVNSGELSPERAEEWARSHGKVACFEYAPPFDPMGEVFWTLGMQLAWFSTESSDSVREM